MSVFTPLFPVAEEEGTRTESHSVEGQGTASVKLRCNALLAPAIVADILVNRRIWPFTPSGFEGPRAATAVVVPADHCDGVGRFLQGYVYSEALITVGYTTDAEADLISESLETTANFIPLDHRLFRWSSPDGKAVLEDESPGFQYYTGRLIRTLFNVEPPLPLSMLTLQGSCNSATFASSLLGLSFAPETLLYKSPALSRTVTTNGARGWDLKFDFPFTQFGWNRFFNGDTQSWEQIFLAGEEGAAAQPVRPYRLANFSEYLF